MSGKNVPGDEWIEVVGASLEDDYTVVVENAPIYLAVGDEPDKAIAGLPLRKDAMRSAEIDRGDRVYARSQTDVAATVRVVPGVRLEGSNERAVTVQAAVNTYDRGESFDTGGSDSFPLEFSPDEDIEQVLLSIVGDEVNVELTTVDGNIVNIPVDGKATIDSYTANSVTITDTNGTTPRIAGGWAGE